MKNFNQWKISTLFSPFFSTVCSCCLPTRSQEGLPVTDREVPKSPLLLGCVKLHCDDCVLPAPCCLTCSYNKVGIEMPRQTSTIRLCTGMKLLFDDQLSAISFCTIIMIETDVSRVSTATWFLTILLRQLPWTWCHRISLVGCSEESENIKHVFRTASPAGTYLGCTPGANWSNLFFVSRKMQCQCYRPRCLPGRLGMWRMLSLYVNNGHCTMLN